MNAGPLLIMVNEMLFTFPALLTLGSLVKSTVTLPERSVSETERVVVVVVVAMVEVVVAALPPAEVLG